jgi:NAD(P)H-dependent FMN reductase
MTKIAIIVGSTRPARAGTAVARWVHEIALRHGDADYELIDLKDVGLPALDEDLAPMLGRYSRPHTHRWSEQISPFDGYVFVTPEYNHGMPAALKNAIDFLYAEWNNKAAAFVSYGSEGGVRAVEQLRQVMAQVRIADVGSAATLFLAEDFVNYTEFRPRDFQEQSVRTMLDELTSWSEALRTLRGRSGSGQATLASSQ